MLNIPGYTSHELIYESENALVYRALQEQDQLPVVLKTHAKEHPEMRELARMRQEYEITQNLEIEGTIRSYALFPYKNGLVLSLEDIEGIALNQILASEKLDLEHFFKIAITVTESLGAIHAANIIHKDINPSNILINPHTEVVKIIDFGISSILSEEQQQVVNPDTLEGTLRYISPEQTGRMNRPIDYRTDFYSLGATFYEMLSGHPPFTVSDSLELVHHHIAKIPPPLCQLNPEIPQVLSDIILKLMSKTAEERYQSAYGLKSDLQTCWAQWQSQGHIPIFGLGQTDTPHQFHISQELYGRQSERDQLLAAFSRINEHGKPEMVLVSGVSGIGKSRLIHEIYKPITEQKGYFISGKFDQLQHNIPYQALIPAFQQMIQQILTESATRIERFREHLLQALGENAQVIIEVIPEVEWIIGPQPPVSPLPSAESQNRFNLVFQKFVHVFAQKEHPLVLFLDDLQWADLATLGFLEILMTNPVTQDFLLIGAYRDNEVDATHPLIHTLENIRKFNVVNNTVVLTALNLEHINQLLCDTLYTTDEKTRALAQITLEKTHGNPFFINQFLKSLYEAKCFRFETTLGEWGWEIEKIVQMGITDNVVDLLIEKILKLSPKTQRVLQWAACIGNQFDLHSLHIVSEQSPAATIQDLWEALQEMLILPIGSRYKDFRGDESHLAPEQLKKIHYRFQHDRVQQAAYGLIADEARQPIHLKIGRNLRQDRGIGAQDSDLFEMVHHLNFAKELIVDPQEILVLAQLNANACLKAKDAVAYKAALEYARIGMALLEREAWHTQYDLMLTLATARLECEYLNGNYKASEQYFQEILSHVRSDLEKADVYSLQTLLYENQALHENAAECALEGLRMLGFHLSRHTGKATVVVEFLRLQRLLWGKSEEDLLNLPKMTDSEKQAIVRLLGSLGVASYFLNMDLFAALVIHVFRITLEDGIAEDSAFAICAYGVIIGSALWNYNAGRRIAEMTFQMNEIWGSRLFESRINLVFGALHNHWKQPAKSNEEYITKAYYLALEMGDLLYAGLESAMLIATKVFQGVPIEEIQETLHPYLEFVERTQQRDVRHFFTSTLEFFNRMQGVSSELSYTNYDSPEELEDIRKINPVALHWYYLHQAKAAYLFNDPDKALHFIKPAQALIARYIGLGTIDQAEHQFYYSLILADACPTVNVVQKLLFHGILVWNQVKMRLWAYHCQENYLHKYLLVEAERARLMGRTRRAMHLYDQAIQLAQQYGYLQDTALASERAARFYHDLNHDSIAKIYLHDAQYAYLKWGAHGKARTLEEQYPYLMSTHPSSASTSVSSDSTISLTNEGKRATSYSTTDSLDLYSVMKASQTLSGEIKFTNLLTELMNIVIENAGAQKGYLLLKSGQEETWRIEAEKSIDSDQIAVLQSIPITEHQRLPESIVQYVEWTSRNVVLNDAAHEGNFTQDPYILQHQPQSILCTPIVHQGKLLGMLYLENNLTAGAFTMDRVELLSLLSSQTAISIENAQLYENLESLVTERTAQLEERKQALEVSNQTLEKTLEDLHNSQSQLVQAEKMASLGQLVTNIAHEVNTPAGAIASAITELQQDASLLQEQLSNLLQSLPAQLHPLYLKACQVVSEAEKNLSTKEARKIARAIRRGLEEHGVDNAAEMGQDLARIGLTAETMEEFIPLFLAPQAPVIHQALERLGMNQVRVENIKIATGRITQLIKALKSYAHVDTTGLSPTVLKEDLENTLMILNNKLKRAITVHKEFEDLPPYTCYADQLNQVWTNLIHNAIQAMNGEGDIILRLKNYSDVELLVEIEDNGPGIPEAIMTKIFDPYFTTKAKGEGSGMGLHICKDIVERHHGRLEVHSQPGMTRFSVILPWQVPESDKQSKPLPE